MKKSQVYLKAAQRIDSGKDIYSCHAILHVSRDTLLMEGYCRSMGFTGCVDFTEADGAVYDDTYIWINPVAREHRVLLLLLASAIAKSEGQ